MRLSKIVLAVLPLVAASAAHAQVVVPPSKALPRVQVTFTVPVIIPPNTPPDQVLEMTAAARKTIYAAINKECDNIVAAFHTGCRPSGLININSMPAGPIYGALPMTLNVTATVPFDLSPDTPANKNSQTDPL
ncbi:hypothetical protein [Methylovirgula sp. 4M-Z18]|uniref:hypothetical protein n=1 Tax=Methylovirgula sp. 4M-Z18 TaxID=2293567 RepID=UPI000E2E49D2|nr:hypothetical protein [Methylovirgula sp. 4M-Z18]RFB78598.1 hypothetical protein DYH55_15425 [Methylovirgula sp. 4M-Z18]